MAWFSRPGEIKVGVVGYGGAFNMGRSHLNEMRRAGMKPHAVCEIDADRLKIAEQDFPGIETYDSLEGMLKRSDVNLIVHITPHNLHYPLAAKCLKAGRHVVTEKPFVISTGEADKLIALAEKHDAMVSTYHNRHWDGCVLEAVKQVRRKQVVGELVKVEAHMGGYGMPGQWWRTSKSISGGVLYDWGVHLLEYALQCIEGQIVEVVGFAHTGYWASQMPKDHPWKDDCNEDEASAIVRFDTGAMLYLTISTLRSYQRPGLIEFVGTKGTYEMHHDRYVLRRPAKKRDGKGRLVLEEKTGENPQSKGHLFYRNVARYLCGQEDLVITPQWARRPIHILDLADRSTRTGKAVKAKYG
jgi:predicted dehydrogenase